jgi:hypothetical protein
MTSTGATIGPREQHRPLTAPSSGWAPSTSQRRYSAAHAQLIAGWLSVAVMGSCGIGHFAPGRGAVGLGLTVWEGQPYDDTIARRAAGHDVRVRAYR